MSFAPDARRRGLTITCLACLASLAAAGCHDTASGVAQPSVAGSVRSARAATDAEPTQPIEPDAAPAGRDLADSSRDDELGTAGPTVSSVAASPLAEPAAPPAKHRKFAAEGPDGALRVGFDDLDLLKVLRMDPVTPDCVEKMPEWLRGLDGKQVRIRGFMKPSMMVDHIPQFMLVRDTGLCCFGPKGKIYDMIVVTLNPGTTTDYIELRPFDVVGKFRIELETLEDEGQVLIHQLYCLDDAQIIQGQK
ncbi:MAG: hypothetical protein ACT4QC_04435 [Planctomycetaceae bacterium]